MDLISYVPQDPAWLQIDVYAIETLTTSITDTPATDDITARSMPDGTLLLQGRLIPFGSRNASEDAKLFFGQAIQKIVA